MEDNPKKKLPGGSSPEQRLDPSIEENTSRFVRQDTDDGSQYAELDDLSGSTSINRAKNKKKALSNEESSDDPGHSLVSSDVDVNKIDGLGMTPLHRAARFGSKQAP